MKKIRQVIHGEYVATPIKTLSMGKHHIGYPKVDAQ